MRKEIFLPVTVKCNQTEVMEKCTKKLNQFKIKYEQDIELPVGFEYLAEKHRASILQADLNQSNFEEFLKMVQPGMENTQRQTILRLICAILSSYCIRLIVKGPSTDDYNFDPEELKSCSIQDDTFLMVRGYKDEDSYWPAPYRDTAVILDARKLKKSDIVEVASINPWCFCIIYGKNFSIPFRYNEHIDGSACEYWGYLRMFSPGNDRAKEFPALYFRQKGFEKAVSIYRDHLIRAPKNSSNHFEKKLPTIYTMWLRGGFQLEPKKMMALLMQSLLISGICFFAI